MESDAEIHCQVLGPAPRVLLKSLESCWREGGGLYQPVVMTEEPTETADLSSWELRGSEPAARKPSWDWPMPSVYVWQLCRLVYLWGSYQWDQDMSLELQLVFRILFPMLSCLSQSWCREKSLILPQIDVPCFADTHGRPASLWMETEEECMGV